MFKASMRCWTAAVFLASAVSVSLPVAASDFSVLPNAPTPHRQSDPPPGSTPKPPKAVDGIYVAENLGSTCAFETGSPIRINLKIPRYVGETTADGRLKDPAGAVAAGVIAPDATLEIPIWDIDNSVPPHWPFRPEVNIAYINGNRLGILTGSDSQWSRNTFTVPLNHLRFPVQPGGEPGNNLITIDIDSANGDPNWCTAVEWVSLTLKSMAPIVLVHGNNSDPGFFDRQGCTAGLRQAKVPYILGPQLPTAPTLGQGGNGEALAAALHAIASRQTSSGVHVLAHSKGGLDSRAAIQSLGEWQPRVVPSSLATLSTPHLGTLLANLRDEMARLANAGVAVEFFGFPRFADLVAEKTEADAGLSSLTASGTDLLTAQTPRARFTPTVYVAADADRNGNKKIDTHGDNIEFIALANENIPLKDILNSSAGRAAIVVDRLYQTLAKTADISVQYSSKDTEFGNVSVAKIFAIRASEWRPNDTLVPTYSGLAQAAQPWQAEARLIYAGADGKNHSDVASAAVCSAVAQQLINIDRRAGGMR